MKTIKSITPRQLTRTHRFGIAALALHAASGGSALADDKGPAKGKPTGTFVAPGSVHAAGVKVAPADALARLTEGNQRFVEDKLEHPRQGEHHDLNTGAVEFFKDAPAK